MYSAEQYRMFRWCPYDIALPVTPLESVGHQVQFTPFVSTADLDPLCQQAPGTESGITCTLWNLADGLTALRRCPAGSALSVSGSHSSSGPIQGHMALPRQHRLQSDCCLASCARSVYKQACFRCLLIRARYISGCMCML